MKCRIDVGKKEVGRSGALTMLPHSLTTSEVPPPLLLYRRRNLFGQ